MTNSGRFTLTGKDWKKWATDTAYFFAPALLIFIGALQTGSTFQEALTPLYGWLLSAVFNLVRKWYTDHTPSS